MTLAQDFESGAAEILKQFGKDITLRAIVQGAYNLATNTQATTTVDYPCRAYIGSYSDFTISQSSSILKSDRKCTIQAKGLLDSSRNPVIPKVGWAIVAQDGTFSIIDVARKEISDVSVVWVCQIRRGD